MSLVDLMNNDKEQDTKLAMLASAQNPTITHDTLSQHYQAMLKSEHFHFDVEQQRLVQALQLLSDELIEAECDTLLCNMMSMFQKHDQVKGLYIAGGVGRGKTFLMDLFFQYLPIKKKQRVHFQVFMQQVHESLARLSEEADPLVKVAEQFSTQTRVLCLDEMLVNDVADAMILAELLQQLQMRGVVFVMTSNILPENLYRNGLQRSRFLPAIDLIKQHTRLMVLEDGQDYRQMSKQQERFIRSAGELSEQRLKRVFHELAGTESKQICGKKINVNRRPIEIKCCVDQIAWFDFSALCETARSTQDYLQIAHRFAVVIVSDVPVMHDANNDVARRFINMIDAFYDKQVQLVFSAEAEPEALYQGQRLATEFKRTASRLVEMQQPKHKALAS